MIYYLTVEYYPESDRYLWTKHTNREEAIRYKCECLSDAKKYGNDAYICKVWQSHRILEHWQDKGFPTGVEIK